MKPQTVSETALGTAAGRAIETSRPGPDRLFDDPFAMAFLPGRMRRIVRLVRIPIVGSALLAMRERQIPGVAGNLLCRTRFIDDIYREALWDGCEQAVILGAGLDSRALRIPAPGTVRVFEVDHPATQAWKRERLEALEDGIPAQLTLVPVDFERDNLGEELDRAGFGADLATLFIWEGVTQYIGGEAVDTTLRWVSQEVVPGSWMVFTYIVKGVIDGSHPLPGSERIMEELEKRGEPWRFGIEPDELERYLSQRGFELLEDVGASDYRSLYLKPMSREMDVFEGERVAVARVRNGVHENPLDWRSS